MLIRKYMSPEPGAETAAPGPADNQGGTVVPEKKAEAASVAVVVPEKEAEVVPARTAEERLKRLDEIEQTIDAKAKAIDSKTAAIEARLETARKKAVLERLRKMGADPERISDERLLKIAPVVDPDENSAAADAEFLKFKASEPGLFRPAHIGPQEQLGNYTKRVEDDSNLTPKQKERKLRMANTLMGGK